LASTIVIRTSIVGTDGGLLGWLLDQHGDVDGYTNHLWNGVTTLEWARVCVDLIEQMGARPAGILHVASQQTVSKAELLESAVSVFGLPVHVRPTLGEQSINRALSPTIERPAIRAQLEELRDWEPLRA
jgi:dTDP-4-dehydrorhamnose reductase